MDRGRNLEALAEEDDEEEMEEHRDKDSESDASSTDTDDEPDVGTKRGEPNKFDILCDGVNNSMALVHTALEELLAMKDEMLKHSLPPTVLIKLATNTGKVFRSISDLNMPVNELVRLVRVYSTPWEEKSAALKKLHEDYEVKQRQLNIAIKRLQLVDAHSKRIAREKRVMNWEKLFAKMMSNKGHGRRWKFLIETIKQKAKLGLEHVQEFTRALEESSDEDEEDDMPTVQLKRMGGSPTSASDKISESETDKDEEEVDQTAVAKEESDSGSDAGKEVPTIVIKEQEDSEEEGEGEEEEEEADTRTVESAKRVRFAEETKPAPKVPTKDSAVWTGEPDYDRFLFVRVYSPVGMTMEDFKCSITFGKQFYKTKRLDTVNSGTKETGKPATPGKATPADPAEPSMKEIKAGRYEEAMFSLPERTPDGIWQPVKPKIEEPVNCQITVHSGPLDDIIAMATIELSDLQDLNLADVVLPPPHGDDDVPKTPEPDDTADLDSLSDDVEIMLPGADGKKDKEGPPAEDLVKDVEPMMFPLYSLDATASAKHKPCGKLPITIYWGNRARPVTYNRQIGTYGVSELVFELTGIDLETTTKADLHKEMVDRSLSAISFSPVMRDEALSALRFTPEKTDPPQPPSSPESLQEEIKEEIASAPSSPEIQTEMIAKSKYDQMVEKHSHDLLLLQEQYEKRLQSLLENMHIMETNQKVQQQQLVQQQQQLQHQQHLNQQLLQQQSSRKHSLKPTSPVPPAPRPNSSPDLKEGRQMLVPQAPRKPRKVTRPPPRQDEFLNRLQYFEEETLRHRQELEDRTRKEIQENLEKKLAGEHKLSRKDEEMYQALTDVSLPALFMPFKTGTIFNPRAHQYFHPTGSSDLRLSQPPSMIQLPPLPRTKTSVVNLFELSKNFNNRPPGWLMDRYIQQQEPVANVNGMVPQTPAPTTQVRSPPFTPQPTQVEFDRGESGPATHPPQQEHRQKELEAEC